MNLPVWQKTCLDEHTDERGNLGVMEFYLFSPERVFFITDVPGSHNINGVRGQHAVRHKEIIVCVQGSVLITLQDVERTQSFRLRPFEVLNLPPMVWIILSSFDPGTVLCVLAEKHFHEREYIRDYDEWKKLVGIT